MNELIIDIESVYFDNLVNLFLRRCENDDLPSIDWVLKRAKASVLRDGVCGLVIDPYNELDHQRTSNQ